MTRYFLIFSSIFTLLIGSLSAFAADPFTVTNISVDATGSTAIEAQEIALKEGQATAAAIMLQRVTLPSETLERGVPTPTPEMIGRMIRALEISNEQRTAQRYFGNVTISFNPTEVQRFLQANRLTLFSSQTQNRLVIPFSRLGSNKLADTLKNGGFEHALTPLIVAQALNGFDPSIALGNIEAAERVAAGYGVRQVLALKSDETLAGTSISMTDISLNTGEARNFGTVTGVTMELAVAAAVERLQDDWKTSSVSLASSVQDLPVSILFNSQSDWQSLQDVIDDSAQIQSARLDAISKDGALMTLSYGGDLDRLTKELSFKGVSLKDDPKLGVIIGRSQYLR
ncbi:MAG: hypothetical protein ABJ275_07210 [Maricaulaceae bacterium]